MCIQKTILSLFVIFGLPLCVFAQISHGGQPIGLQKAFLQSAKSQDIHVQNIGSVDAAALIKEDRIKGLNRIGTGTDISLNLDNSGTWSDLGNGDRLWRIQVNSDNALGMSVLFKSFRLPQGSQLFAYSPDGSQIKGSYNHLNNKPSEKFMIGIIKGSSMIIEYYEPAAVSGLGYFEVYKAFKVYDGAAFQTDLPSTNQKLSAKDFGDASECHINANCTDAEDYQEYKKGVARITIVFEEAIGFCTGTLMNNVLEDKTPYILTAFHCGRAAPDPLYDHWQFDFNYESPNCANPATEPLAQSIQGATRRSGYQDSDFLLLEIDQDLPTSFDVRYHGWDRSEAVPDSAIMMHHPQGDIMKFSFTTDDIEIFASSINWSVGITTPPNHHFRSYLNQGAFETGSSGCALINMSGHVVGQLHGGKSFCENSRTFVGRMSQSWSNTTTTNSLQPYLDPNNQGVMTLDALEEDHQASISISGRIASVKDVPMEGVEMKLSGDRNMTVTTDAAGLYRFDGLAAGGSYEVTPAKATEHFDGISTGDMLVLQRAILDLKPLDTPDKFIAADASNNGRVSTGDMLVLQRMILQIYTEFPNSPAWRFYTSDFPAGLSGPNPFTSVSTTGSLDSAELSAPDEDVVNLDFVGVKIGDANQSVKPNK